MILDLLAESPFFPFKMCRLFVQKEQVTRFTVLWKQHVREILKLSLSALFIPRHTLVAGYYVFTLAVRVSVHLSVVRTSVHTSFPFDIRRDIAFLC